MSFNKVNQTTGELTRIAGNGDIPIDSTPTQGSNHAVQSGGTFSAIKAVSDNVDEVSSQIQTFTKYVNEYGSKNLCPYEDTWSVPTTNTAGRLLASVELKAGDKITFVCTQDNAMTSNVRNTLIIDNPSGVRSVQSASTNNHLSAGLHVMEYTATENGVHKFGIWANTISTATTYSKFMVCYTDVYNLDSTYEPYSKTNRQLTKDSVTWDNLSEVGAVNLLNHNAHDMVHNGITFTVNPDRSVTANGTATAEEWVQIAQNVVVSESVRASGCPKGGTPSTYFMTFSQGGNSYRDYGDGVIVPSGTIDSVYMVIKPNATVNNIVFKPMIAPVSYNGPYVPYAMTNRELTDDVAVKELTFTDFFTLASGYSLSHQVLRKVANGYSIQATIQGSLNIGRNAVATMSTVIGTATEETIFGSGRCLDSNSTYHPVSVGMQIKANAELSVYTDTAITNGYCTFSMIIPF